MARKLTKYDPLGSVLSKIVRLYDLKYFYEVESETYVWVSYITPCQGTLETR